MCLYNTNMCWVQAAVANEPREQQLPLQHHPQVLAAALLLTSPYRDRLRSLPQHTCKRHKCCSDAGSQDRYQYFNAAGRDTAENDGAAADEAADDEAADEPGKQACPHPGFCKLMPALCCQSAAQCTDAVLMLLDTR